MYKCVLLQYSEKPHRFYVCQWLWTRWRRRRWRQQVYLGHGIWTHVRDLCPHRVLHFRTLSCARARVRRPFCARRRRTENLVRRHTAVDRCVFQMRRALRTIERSPARGNEKKKSHFAYSPIRAFYHSANNICLQSSQVGRKRLLFFFFVTVNSTSIIVTCGSPSSASCPAEKIMLDAVLSHDPYRTSVVDRYFLAGGSTWRRPQ